MKTVFVVTHRHLGSEGTVEVFSSIQGAKNFALDFMAGLGDNFEKICDTRWQCGWEQCVDIEEREVREW